MKLYEFHFPWLEDLRSFDEEEGFVADAAEEADEQSDDPAPGPAAAAAADEIRERYAGEPEYFVRRKTREAMEASRSVETTSTPRLSTTI